MARKGFSLAREEVRRGRNFVGEGYDALPRQLLTPNMTTDRVAKLFTHLETQLVPMVAALRDSRETGLNPFATREFPSRPADTILGDSRNRTRI